MRLTHISYSYIKTQKNSKFFTPLKYLKKKDYYEEHIKTNFKNKKI
jgi:hypothetical protein